MTGKDFDGSAQDLVWFSCRKLGCIGPERLLIKLPFSSFSECVVPQQLPATMKMLYSKYKTSGILQ